MPILLPFTKTITLSLESKINIPIFGFVCNLIYIYKKRELDLVVFFL